MPILPAEPALYPDNLLTLPDPDLPPQGEWRVLHTRPRQEKSLARDLSLKGTPYYLPLVRQRRRIRDRVVTSFLPLFDGYLFLFSSRDAYIDALSTQRVVRALVVPDQQRLWTDLRQLYQLTNSGLAVTAEPCLLPGQLVEITSGPLTGFRGRIVRSASGRRFVVEVDFICRGASVLCDGMTLQPLVDLC
jgi:transcriptional antiterminator RfaH